MPDLTATFRKPFAEQVAAFRLRLGDLVPTSRWDDISRSQHDRAFMVAGAMKADLLADLGAAVDKAIAEGTTLEEFRRDFRAIVEKRGWHGWTGEGTKGGEAWRTRVVYKTNLATTYAAGRMAQLVEGGFAFWVYRHGGSLEPRIIHLGWDGVVLPADHEFWATHAPPNGWGCSCYIVGARSLEGARRLGGDPGKKLPPNWKKLDPKTGAPEGIDKGWDYAPGATAVDTILNNKLPGLPAPIGASMFAALPRRTVDELVERFDGFVAHALANRVERNFMVIGALKPGWVEAAKARGITVTSAEIAVTDLNIQHTFRGTPHVTYVGTRIPRSAPKLGPLDIAWYKELPRHLLVPKAVLLDRTGKEPVFLLLYDVPGSVAKLVVEIDTPLKKARGVLNTIESGRLITMRDVLGMIGQGIEVIDGAI